MATARALHPGLLHLASLPLWSGTKNFTLEKPAAILKELGNPQNNIRAVHVAGTNGKGTVCTYLAAMLHAQGFSVGQIASPHLTNVTERALINGWPVEEESLGDAVLEVLRVSKSLGCGASYFETVVIASYLEFARKKLDWMIVEVGLGGRLDATNVLENPAACVITNISFDHTDILGSTLAAIAKEKAGIIKSKVPIFVGRMETEASAAIKEVAMELGSPVKVFGEDIKYDESARSIKVFSEEFLFKQGEIEGRADYQLENAALSVVVAKSLNVSESAIRSGLVSARWPGRIEFLSWPIKDQVISNSNILLDVAHNPAGIAALLNFLKTYCNSRPQIKNLTFLISILDRKDWKAMLADAGEFEMSFCLKAGIEVKWIFTDSGYSNTVPPNSLREAVGRGEEITDPEAALHAALPHAGEDTLVVITGSIFHVGRLRPLLTDKPFCTIART